MSSDATIVPVKLRERDSIAFLSVIVFLTLYHIDTAVIC
jgi:hypothetical protein